MQPTVPGLQMAKKLAFTAAIAPDGQTCIGAMRVLFCSGVESTYTSTEFYSTSSPPDEPIL